MKFKENDWVYVVYRDNYFKWHVAPAIVQSHYNKYVSAGYPVSFNGYTLDGKPIKEMEKWETKWKKYPKDRKDVYKEICAHEIAPRYILPEEVYKSTSVFDHETCQRLVNESAIIAKTFRTPWVDYELSKGGKEYRLVLKWIDTSNNLGLGNERNGRGGYNVIEDNVFYTHAEAVSKLKEIKAEEERFASLSELEQCLEEHEHYLLRYFDKETVNVYLDKIKSMDNAEDVEIKISNTWSDDGSYVVYWRYFRSSGVKPLPKSDNHKETKAEREARNKAWVDNSRKRWFSNWDELKL